MTDRLKELKSGAKPATSDSVAITIDNTDRAGLVKNDGNKATGNSNSMANMETFFTDVDMIKGHINFIKETSAKVEDINQQVVLATNSDKEAEITAGFQTLINNTNKRAALAKKMLQSLQEDTARMKTDSKAKSSEIRIRENLCVTLTRKFVEVMKDYQSVQTKYKIDIKKKVKRQVQIAKPDASEEEVEAILRAGGGTGEVFKNSILKGEASDSIQNTYQNAADKYQDVLALEASVAMLHQMFMDFALLTEQQGELLDQIEHQVHAAGDFIDEGNKEMVEAIDLQIAIRKKQALCCFLLLVIVGIIVGIIYATQKGKAAALGRR